MTSRREQVTENLAMAALRLDNLLNPWGFSFLCDAA